MTQIQANISDNVQDTLKIGIYTVYDCVLKQFGAPICVPISKIDDYMIAIVNETTSPYYHHEQDFVLNKIGDFDVTNGVITTHFCERLKFLDKYVSREKRKLQTIIQTLNFMPVGYYKMPEDRKKDIQEKIDIAIKEYVENYVVPEIDLNKAKETLNK